MCPGRIGDEARQVFPHVPAGAEERGDDPDLARSCRGERGDGFAQIRSHAFKIGDAHFEAGAVQARADLLEWLRPLRIARPVREKDDAFLQCSRLVQSLAAPFVDSLQEAQRA